MSQVIIPVNNKCQIKVEKTTFKGHEIVNVNKMFCTDNDPEFKHGKGVGIPVSSANAIADAIKQVMNPS